MAAIPLANRTLRQLHTPGGFHLREFGYRASEGATVLRRQALRRMFERGISMHYLVRRLKYLAILNNSRQPQSRRMRVDAVWVRQRLYPLEEEKKQQEQAAAQQQDDGFDFGDDNDGPELPPPPPPPPAPAAPAQRGRGRGAVRGFRVGPYVLRSRRQPARRSARQSRQRGRGRGRGRGGRGRGS